MSYLLDTNVISEHTRPRPNANVVAWLRTLPVEEQFLSALSIGEIRNGIERLDDNEGQRERLRLWLKRDLHDLFGDRLLAITARVADRWGRLRAEMGRSVPTVDSLLAATALHHDLRLVTRNERDFLDYPGLVIVNPWKT
jgi:predicted nucleic acid-binding protein